MNKIDILIDGKPVRKWFHNGRWFIEGKNGAEFSIRIKNETSQKKLAIPVIDSINVINGEVNSDSGYIVKPYDTLHINGFRVTNDKVNAFKFASKNKSYAAKSEETGGDTSNCGVIGIKFFLEKQKINWTPFIFQDYNFGNENFRDFLVGGDYNSTAGKPLNADIKITSRSLNQEAKSRAGGQCGAGLGNTLRSYTASVNYCSTQSLAPEPNFDLGTEFSKKEITDKVQNVEFEMGVLEETVEIFYASREALLGMGVPLNRETQVAFPQSFPQNFCKPPRD